MSSGIAYEQLNRKRNWVTDFGAVGDYTGSGDGTDNTASIQACIDYFETLTDPDPFVEQPVIVEFPELPENRGYKITDTITVPLGISVIMRGKVVLVTDDETKPAFVIGNTSKDNSNCEFVLRVHREEASDWSSEECVGVRLINARRCRVWPVDISRFTIGLQGRGDSRGFTYNTIIHPQINRCKIGIDFQTRTGGNSYCNQNTVLAGSINHNSGFNTQKPRTGIRFSKVEGGLNAHNNNVFINTSIELIRNDALFWTSTATAGTSTTLSDAAKTFTDAHIGAEIIIESGTGIGQSRIIASRNSSTQVTLDRAWSITPDATSAYRMQAIVRAVHLIEGEDNDFQDLRAETCGWVLVKTENGARRNKFSFLGGVANQGDDYRTLSLRVEEVGTYRDHIITWPERHQARSKNNSWSSGPIASKAVATTNRVNVAGMSFVSSGSSATNLIQSLGTPGVTIDDHLALTATNVGLGVLLDVRKSKKYIIRKAVDDARPGSCLIRCYDGHPRHGGANMAASDKLLVDSSRGDWAYTASWGGAYVNGSGNNDDVAITLDPAVQWIWVGIFNAKIAGLSIDACEEGPVIVEAGHGYDDGLNYLDAKPTEGSYLAGRRVYSASPTAQISVRTCLASGSPGTWVDSLVSPTSSWMSGNLVANSAANGTNIGIKGMHVELSSSLNMLKYASHGGIAEQGTYLELNANKSTRGFGIVVNATKNKNFLLKKSVDPADPGRFVIRTYDGNPLYGGSVIGGSGDLRVSSSLVSLAWTSAWGGGHQAADSDLEIPILFDSTVKYAAIFMFNGSYQSMEIQALDGYAMEAFPGHGAGDEFAFLDSVPTTGTYVAGQVVRNGSIAAATVVNTRGWQCFVGGSPGTWATDGAFGARAIMLNPTVLEEGEEYHLTSGSATGVEAGDSLAWSFSNTLPDGVILQVQATATDTIKVTVCNIGGGPALDIPSGTLTVRAIR